MRRTPPPLSGGAIAAGHPETVRVGADVLAAGGNAVDACVAAGIASWIAEPTVAGPGGGGFMLVHDPLRRSAVAYDFFTAVPGLCATGRPIAPLEELRVEFGTTTQLFLVGPGSCAVPGVAVGVYEAHRRAGRLPWAELVQPAIRLARTGATLNRGQADLFAILDPLLRNRPSAAEVFGPEGRMLLEGDSVRNERLADTLERYAEHGAAEFATGDTARVIAESQGAEGGPLTASDLAAYRVIARRPVQAEYAGTHVLANPPPSSGGVLIAHSLRVLERIGPQGDPLAPPALLALAHALRSAQAQRGAGFERALYRGGARALVLDDALISASASSPGLRGGEPPTARGTTHVSVIDAVGGAASMTCSTGCGSGWFAGDSGVHLNNMLGEGDLALASLVLRPGDRITSMMSPTIVLGGDGHIRLVVGSSGSSRIRSAVTQVLTRALDGRLALREAVEAPRIHPEAGLLDCEGGFAAEVLDALAEAGEDVVRWPGRNLYFGGAQAVAACPDGRLEAAGDPRRGGAGTVVSERSNGREGASRG
jgi:gamma-glutamyltranspeptidase/glutathione hydrolase